MLLYFLHSLFFIYLFTFNVKVIGKALVLDEIMCWLLSSFGILSKKFILMLCLGNCVSNYSSWLLLF